MSPRAKIILGSLAGAVAIHLLFVACNAIPRTFDAGRDVIQTMLDAEVQDAHAGGTLYTAACDRETSYSTVASNGMYSVTSETRYAVVDVPGFDPRAAPTLSAVVCDRERFGNWPFGTCSAGSTCSQAGAPYPFQACSTAGAVSMDPGKVVVFCGFHTTQVSSGITSESGERFQTAYVRIGQ